MKSFTNILSVFFLFIFLTSAFAQLDLKRDDFVGTANRHWWGWHEEGEATPMPAVSDAYVLFSLVNPTREEEPFCDAALWDGYPYIGGPYSNCKITLRAKALNPHKYGSRGWGLWYTEPYPYVTQQAWFMHMLDDPDSTGINSWRAETAYGPYEITHHYVDLDQEPFMIDDMQWHVYKINRQPGYIHFIVDNDTVLKATEDLPDLGMAFHIWVDNLVYEHVDPDIINLHKRAWIGKNEIVLDYVQILTSGTLGSSEAAENVKLLRQVPNEIYSEPASGLWKEYAFSAPAGNFIMLATARVEQYNLADSTISGDDDIRFVVNGTDYLWNSANSFNGDQDGTVSKTLLLAQSGNAGTQTVQVFGETSPLLYDVTVLGAEKGGIVFDQEYYEEKDALTDSLWKDITFSTKGGWVAVYLSGSADEDSTPVDHGYQYANFDDNEDDDLRIVLDQTDYGYKTDDALYGNRLFGEPKSILVQQNLSAGEHQLKVYTHRSPTLFRIVIYGENDESVSPIKDEAQQAGEFRLAQNYPNPFNNRTKIRFQMRSPALVSAAIYSIDGRKVKKLHNGYLAAGGHTLTWNGRNEQNREVGSGVYFLVFKADKVNVFRKKLILMK